ncbi:NXPE family member 4-like [Asterias rubens]|uniref:NXPE family member 4-like n=1 Tax=Asterias rubens TaxID=7604 RepID=UPI001455D3AB|nr:NXPE family member 4-like [Asterias rubens]
MSMTPSTYRTRVWRTFWATRQSSPTRRRPSLADKCVTFLRRSSLLDLFLILVICSSIASTLFIWTTRYYRAHTHTSRQDQTAITKISSLTVVHHQPTTNSSRVKTLKQNLQNLEETSALHSTYSLTNRELHVGDTAHFIIQAKDAEGRNQVTGGDFWFPVLTGDVGAYPVKGGRTAGRVVDHKNGTYSVFFYAGWEGIAYVHMTLAATSEATTWLRTKYWPSERLAFWDGEFSGASTLDGQKTTEITSCFLLRKVTSPNLCRIDYNPKATGSTALYCKLPERLKCVDFKTVKMNGDVTGVMNNLFIGKDKRLFQGDNYMATLTRGSKTIDISNAKNNITKHQDCRPNDEPLMNDGFWLNDEWHHLQCNVRRWDDVQAVKRCLRHKHVFILGDSNVRSWYKVLMKRIGYTEWSTLDKEEHARISMDYKNEDLEMSFRSHPRLVTAVKTTLNETLYEVDFLDNIPSDSCQKFIIVFCPWGHFTQWSTESYVERTQLLKEAVLRFRERCPDVPMVIKGAHARDHFILAQKVYANDYTLWNLGRILKETFRGTGLYYYDIWQMGLAYGKQNMHMPWEVVEEEVNWLLSYACKKDNKD